MSAKIVAIVGSYRKDGVTERAVEAVLEGARAHGAETRKFLLRETYLEFCTNCRSCTQVPGQARGRCAQQDGLEEILSAVEDADAVVLASPVNYYNTTALFRRSRRRFKAASSCWRCAAARRRVAPLSVRVQSTKNVAAPIPWGVWMLLPR